MCLESEERREGVRNGNVIHAHVHLLYLAYHNIMNYKRPVYSLYCIPKSLSEFLNDQVLLLS